jgi:putative Mg2+ transporter-C (MgtC) family protein
MDILTAISGTFNIEAFGQLLLAAFLGTLVGMEREISRKSAGMRTYALISTGSAFFSLLSVLFYEQLGRPTPGLDPSRIISQIVVGVGFIGAGLIIFQGSKVQGLTTAAGIWVVAAIGMAVGLKFYDIAIFASLLTITIFILLWNIEERIVKKFSNEPRHDQVVE